MARLSPLEYFKLKDAIVTHNYLSGGKIKNSLREKYKKCIMLEKSIRLSDTAYLAMRSLQYLQKGLVLSMNEKLMNRILEKREVKFDELPEGFDIQLLPEDVEIILDGIFEEDLQELEDEFWADDDKE